MNIIDEPGPRREAQILDLAKSGQLAGIDWHELTLRRGELSCTIRVSSDAIKLRDGTRITVSMPTAQRIADLFDASIITSKICDEIWMAADVVLSPMPIAPDAKMAYWHRTIAHSQSVDRQLAGRTGLVAPVGKDFVLCNRALFTGGGRCAIYGWHLPGGKPIQPVSTRHVRDYTDYSQTLRLVHNVVTVDGESRQLAEVLQSPDLASLLSHEGPLQAVRVPGVDREDYRDETNARADSVAAWQDPAKSRAERMVRWALSHVGHEETPTGSNRSPLIDEWLSKCVRDLDDDGLPDPLPLRGTEWCAAFVGAAERESRLPGERELFPSYPSGIELERLFGAETAGRKRIDAKAIIDGTERIRRGDVLIWQRGRGWTRHVSLALSTVIDGRVETVGGNESHGVRHSAKALGGLLYVLRHTEDVYRAPMPVAVETKPVAERTVDPWEKWSQLMTRILGLFRR